MATNLRVLTDAPTEGTVVDFLTDALRECNEDRFESCVVILVRADGSSEHWRTYPSRKVGAVLGALELTKFDAMRG